MTIQKGSSTIPASTNNTLQIYNREGALTISSKDFSAGLGIQHKNLLATIRAHQSEIEADFGQVAFDTEVVGDSAFETPNLGKYLKRSTKPLTVAHLTEDQALFVGTLSRNSQRVVTFKSVLVRSFAEARRLISERSTAEQARRLAELEEQVRQLLTIQRQGAQALLDSPRSSEPVPAETTRAKVQRIVNAYCQATSQKQQDVWRKVYQQMYYCYNVRIRSYKKGERESWLDVADRTGHLGKIFAIVSAELRF